MKTPTILIVDDDQNIRFAFRKTFEKRKYKILTAASGKEALKVLKENAPSLIFMDIMMPGTDGLEILQKIKEAHTTIPVIIITGYGTMQTAMKAIKLGAYEYLTKPLDIDKVRLIADRALEMVRLREALDHIKERSFQDTEKYSLIGKSEWMQEVYKKMGAAAASPNSTNILIQGESGTGKELVARAIHNNSSHPQEPFVAVNCTALPDNLFESELFGYEKGAFTGAFERRIGLLERAGKGTIFLDEIGDLSIYLQQKLLRVLQEREYYRLGGTQALQVEARFIAATHHDLEEEVKAKRFREDLFYRLNVVIIQLPPLRERRNDIPLLANFFLQRYNQKLKKNIKLISNEAMEFLQNYDYPGNVRELENLIERAVILEKGDILSLNAIHGFANSPILIPHNSPSISSPIYQEARRAWLEEFEKRFIIERLKANKGNVTAAAREAQIQRQSFQRLMKKHHIKSSDFKT